jgi:hypothetical protein
MPKLPYQELVDYLKTLPNSEQRLIIKSLTQFCLNHTRLEGKFNNDIIAGYDVTNGYGWLSDIALGLFASWQVSKLANKVKSLRTGRSTRAYQEAQRQLEAAHAVRNLFMSDLKMTVALAFDNAAKLTSDDHAALIVLANLEGYLPKLVLKYGYTVENALLAHDRIKSLNPNMRAAFERFWAIDALPGDHYYGWSAPKIMREFQVDSIQAIFILDEIVQSEGAALPRLKKAFGVTAQPT